LYPAKGKVKRLYVLGLGSRSESSADDLRKASGLLLRAAFSGGVRKLACQIQAGVGSRFDADTVGGALGDGLALANFRFDTFLGAGQKSQESSSSRSSLSVQIDLDARPSLKRALAVGESVNFARSLSATPPNVANPAYIAKVCRQMSRRTTLRCTVIDRKKAEELKMGGLLAVGQAGSTPPVLVVLEHRPTRPKTAGTLLLVGKAITFDTGGYSLKVNNGMVGMKYDKCGGMSVIGAMEAIARLNLPVRVVGLVAAAENMVSTTAYRPDDIITFCNGVTCEVTNTDAEGRLVLADALAYGCRKYKPAGVIDVATLTGGVVVTLGHTAAGVFCNDDKFRSHLFAASESTGERLWHLPLWEEHRDLMKGQHGDIVNSSRAGRGAHPIQGAAFLSYFAAPGGDPSRAGEIPWAHIDIAGVADTKEASALYEPGPTGFGVRLLTRVVETWA
ncbi:MAG: leucyl aminopeptidase, partial [Phycisphaerae bacterium]|nr:leucyl aminopeptidase [Phycisphaerae bacterium]